jgi:AbrB family looped-hinge helix DNA binding protein
MSRVTVSSRFRVVIPQDVRKSLKLRPGSRLEVSEHDGRIEMITVHDMQKMRGFLQGIDTTVPFEKDRV